MTEPTTTPACHHSDNEYHNHVGLLTDAILRIGQAAGVLRTDVAGIGGPEALMFADETAEHVRALLAAATDRDYWKRIAEAHGPCSCDTNPETTGGPEEDCPQHGHRSPRHRLRRHHRARPPRRPTMTPTSLTVDVVGDPVQQGSKTAGLAGNGRPYLRDSNAKKLKPWRAEMAGCITAAMAEQRWTTLDAPAEVLITFHLPRPAAHFGSGRNSGVLKDSAPAWKSTMPDIDKLTRAVLDAITTSQALRDDARVARLVVEKRYAVNATGARIVITPLITSPVVTSTPTAGEASSVQEALL